MLVLVWTCDRRGASRNLKNFHALVCDEQSHRVINDENMVWTFQVIATTNMAHEGAVEAPHRHVPTKILHDVQQTTRETQRKRPQPVGGIGIIIKASLERTIETKHADAIVVAIGNEQQIIHTAHAARKRELTVARTRAPNPSHELAIEAEHTDAMSVKLRDEELIFHHQHTMRTIELASTRAPAAELAQEAAVDVEYRHAVVVRVSDIDEVTRHAHSCWTRKLTITAAISRADDANE